MANESVQVIRMPDLGPIQTTPRALPGGCQVYCANEPTTRPSVCGSQLTDTTTIADAFTYDGSTDLGGNPSSVDLATGLFVFETSDGAGSYLRTAAYPPSDLSTNTIVRTIVNTSAPATDAGGTVIDGAGHAWWVVGTFSLGHFDGWLERINLSDGSATTIYTLPHDSVSIRTIYDGVTDSVFMLQTDFTTRDSYGAFGRRDLVQIDATTGSATTVATDLGMGYTYDATSLRGTMYASPNGDIYGTITGDLAGTVSNPPFGLWRWDGSSITYSSLAFEGAFLETGSGFAAVASGANVKIAYDLSYTSSACDNLSPYPHRDGRFIARVPGHAQMVYSRDDNTNGAWWIIPGVESVVSIPLELSQRSTVNIRIVWPEDPTGLWPTTPDWWIDPADGGGSKISSPNSVRRLTTAVTRDPGSWPITAHGEAQITAIVGSNTEDDCVTYEVGG